MIEEIETLQALSRHQTMGKAATALRITQSTVSKRIANLEARLEKSLIEKNGRRVELTYEAKRFLEKAVPHLNGLKDAMEEESSPFQAQVVIGFSESILSSWGAKVLKRIKNHGECFEIVPHAHRSPVVIDRVRSGEYLLGVCSGFCAKAPDLNVEEIGREKFVIIESSQTNPLMSIESFSETWQSIQSQCRRLKIQPDSQLESYNSIIQLANQGVVNALVPLGIAKSYAKRNLKIKKTKVTRPIILIARKTTLSRKSMDVDLEIFREAIKTEINSVNIL